jgi:DNA polymerase elongation subunit (family B)
MISIDEKSYLLYKNGKIIKHGSGILGRHIPYVIDLFIDELAFALFHKEDPCNIYRKWDKRRLQGFDHNAFVSFITLAKRPDSYNETTQYAGLINKLRRANIAVAWGDRINFVKTKNGYMPTILLKSSDEIDYRYYQSRMSDIASRMTQTPFKQIREFFDSQIKLGEFL